MWLLVLRVEVGGCWVGRQTRADKGWANDRTTSEHFACSAWSKYDDVQRGLCAGGGKLADGRDARMARWGRVSKQVGDCVRAEYRMYSTTQYSAARYSTCACACVSLPRYSSWLAGQLAACLSVNQSVSQSVYPARAPRGKMSRAGHDPSLGRIDGCTWSPPLLRYCG